MLFLRVQLLCKSHLWGRNPRERVGAARRLSGSHRGFIGFDDPMLAGLFQRNRLAITIMGREHSPTRAGRRLASVPRMPHLHVIDDTFDEVCQRFPS